LGAGSASAAEILGAGGDDALPVLVLAVPAQKACGGHDAGTARYVKMVELLTDWRSAMNFGQALEQLKIGNRVARSGWNGKDMFLFFVPGSKFTVNRAPLLGIYPEGTEISYSAHVDMKTAQGDVVPWLCSQTDMLAEDWVVVGWGA
jgi:hypothetical protein